MKNIHVLQENIYITSDEFIEEVDFGLHLSTKKIVQYDGIKGLDSYYKKIILTTDQDLIKDGVQAIDDEFLEWFVKNPRCESVEVKHKEVIQYGNMTMYDHNGDGSHYFCKDCEVETSRSKEELLKFGVEYYKIITPKEELKQIKCYCGHTTYCDCGPLEEPKDVVLGYKTSIVAQMLDRIDLEEPKQETLGKEFYESTDKVITIKRQETLEEAAETFLPRSEVEHDTDFIIGFEQGAKWQQERSYSEEEVKDIVKEFDKDFYSGTVERNGHTNKWFEQFKKE